MANPLSDDNIERIRSALCAGRKIEAIKLYREATGVGLKDAKDYIDALEVELRQKAPEQFTVPPGRTGYFSKGILLLLFFGVIVSTWLV